MEPCMMKPEVKKKPKPPKPPPKPVEINRNAPGLEKPTPAVPSRPTDAELSHTQYRIKQLADKQTNGNSEPREVKENQMETPVVPPRPTEKEMNTTTRHDHHKRVQAEDVQSSTELPKDDTDFKQKNPSVSGMFRRSQKEKTASFTSYVINNCDEEEKPDDALNKHAAASKPDIGGLLSGMFRKAAKDKSSVNKAESDAEDTEEAEEAEEEKTSEHHNEKGGFFSGILKKSNKPADETSKVRNLSVNAELSGSSDSLSENNKEKGGIFSGMFKKKPAEAAHSEEDRQSLHSNLSSSSDTPSENSKEKGFFSGILRKPHKTPGEGKPGQGAEAFHSELSGSSDSLSENKEKGGLFSGFLRKTHTKTGEENLSAHKDLSSSNDSLSEAANTKEKGGVFSGMFKKSSRLADAPNAEEDGEEQKELSTSNEHLSENTTTKEKSIFSNMFRKQQKAAEGAAADKVLNSEKPLSGSSENLLDTSVPKEKKGGLAAKFKRSSSIDNLFDEEKGGLFSGLLKKTAKASGEEEAADDKDPQKELTASNDSLCDTSSSSKEKSIFSGIFKKTQKPAEETTADEESNPADQKKLTASRESLSEENTLKEKPGGLAGIFKKSPQPAPRSIAAKNPLSDTKELSTSCDNLTEHSKEKGGLFSGLLKKTAKASGEEEAADDKDSQKELTASNDSLCDTSSSSKEKSIFSGIFKKTQKPAEETTADEESNPVDQKKLTASRESLSEENTLKEKPGGLAGIFKKSPQPAPRSIAAKNPLSDSSALSTSCDNLIINSTDDLSGDELSASNDNLSKERKGGFAGMFRRTPKTLEQQENVDTETLCRSGLKRRRTIKKKRRVVSFRIKKTLPRIPKLNSSQTSDKMPVIEEVVELQDLTPAQESTVELQHLEMANYPTEDRLLEAEQENVELTEWWQTVIGWTEWNETSNFQEEDQEMAMEQAADRLYMAARLFVHLFNQRGASLQKVILELMALADSADEFHKKTVSAAVGGGVASVAGSVATITGLILAPFTFGASIIVTAVGIGVATAGSITSATANITDTVHSNMDRKKVEKMIQGYQEEISDIRECLEFVQEGMDTLQEWDFDKYSQSAAKKALNHNIKHVMKEGGRAGKALMINTDKLISTVQVLGAAGGAAKAVQAISVTTGVMSALFLALDVFFLAKDSHELRKGAKTKFATKIREVCKELQDGLLELNKVKTQLQKTMDGIEVEEYEEIEEVEVEVDDDLESDPKKLAELEQELDLLEEKLDKKVEEEQKKSKEAELQKEKEKEEKREKGELEENKKEAEENKAEKESDKDKGGEELELKKIPDEEKEVNKMGGKAVKPTKDIFQEQSQKESKKDKETENRITAGKHKPESKRDNVKEDTGTNKKADERQKEKEEAGKVKEEVTGRTHRGVSSEKIRSEGESQRSRSSRGEEEGMSGKSERKEAESMRRSSSRSHTDKERKHPTTEGSSSSRFKQSYIKGGEEEQRGARDWRAETSRSRGEKTESEDGKTAETERREVKREHHGSSHQRGSHRSQETAARRERMEREPGDSREEARSYGGGGGGGGGEKRGSRVESARRQFERGGEEERGRRREEGESQRREHRGARPRSNAQLGDGLYI